MRRWLPFRRSCRSYLMIVSLLLFLCLIYRLLESTRLDFGKIEQKRNTNDFMKPHDPSRPVMHLSLNNATSLILELARDYENIEKQQKRILQNIVRMVDAENLDTKDYLNVHMLKHILGNKHDGNKDGLGNVPNPDGDLRKIPAQSHYLISCTNVHDIELKEKKGQGYSKTTYKGYFNGAPVAVKMVTRQVNDIRTCIDKIGKNDPQKDLLRSRCFVFPSFKLMKEILLLEQLQYKGFAQLLGYCIRNEESDTSDLHERGIVNVFELGERISKNIIDTFSWQRRIKQAIDLAEFLDFLEHSPLGSLTVRDFKEEHFLMFNGSLKMIDLDDVDNLERSCTTSVNKESQSEFKKTGNSSECDFNLSCQRGLCLGFNAKHNMKFMNKLFFKRLLVPNVFPQIMAPDLGAILTEIDHDQLSAYQLRTRLTDLLTLPSKN